MDVNYEFIYHNYFFRLLKVKYLEDSLCGSSLVGSDLNGGLM